jgi:hypothetical protein
MSRSLTIKARWDREASVWIATCDDVHGLVVEAATWPRMIDEVELILPDLLALSGYIPEQLSVTFIAKEHFDLAPVARKRRKRLLGLFGKLRWDPTCAYKAERSRH